MRRLQILCVRECFQNCKIICDCGGVKKEIRMNKESVSEYVPSTFREVKLRDVPKAIVGTF